MGYGYICKCTKCSYSFQAKPGVGYFFPSIHDELTEDMKEGRLGPVGRKFFEEHPDGRIPGENVVVRCRSCGCYETVPDLDMYVPKPGASPRSEMDSACSFTGDLTTSYDLCERFDYRCSACGGEAEIVADFEEKLKTHKLPCPKCDGKIREEGRMRWD